MTLAWKGPQPSSQCSHTPGHRAQVLGAPICSEAVLFVSPALRVFGITHFSPVLLIVSSGRIGIWGSLLAAAGRRALCASWRREVRVVLGHRVSLRACAAQGGARRAGGRGRCAPGGGARAEPVLPASLCHSAPPPTLPPRAVRPGWREDGNKGQLRAGRRTRSADTRPRTADLGTARGTPPVAEQERRPRGPCRAGPGG